MRGLVNQSEFKINDSVDQQGTLAQQVAAGDIVAQGFPDNCDINTVTSDETETADVDFDWGATK